MRAPLTPTRRQVGPARVAGVWLAAVASVGAAQTAAGQRSIQSAELSPDTALVAYVTDTAWNAFGELWALGTAPGSVPRRIGPGVAPSWSRDGRLLAYQTLVGGELQLAVWERATGRTRQVTRLPHGIQPSFYASNWPGQEALRLAWSPDGRRIAFASFVRDSVEPVGDSLPIVLTNASPAPKVWAGVLRHTFGGWRYVNGVPTMRMLPDSAGVRAPNESMQLLVADVATGAVTQLTTGADGAFDPAWSPDGRTIAFVSGEGEPMLASRLRTTNLYRISADGTGRTALTRLAHDGAGGGKNYAPVWSSDGTMLLFKHLAPGAYVPEGPRVLNVATGEVVTDSARAAATLARAVPLAARPGVVNVGGGRNRTRIVLALPSRAPRTLVDLGSAPPPAAAGGVDTVRWTGARGKSIEGRLRLPKGYVKGRRYPLVVDPYGEWQTPDTLTSAGFVVFSPYPRAPHAPGDVEENPVAYRQLAVDSPSVAIDILVEDVMSGVDTLVRRGLVDSTRMALVGFSNGGGAVNYLVTRTDRFRCAVAQSPAVGDWISNFFMDPDGEYFLTFLNGATPWSHPHTYAGLSSVLDVDRIHTPMLYAVGDEEGIGFIGDALEMYAGLRRLKRPVTVVRYPNQGHGLTGWALHDLAVRTRRFVEQCTGKAP